METAILMDHISLIIALVELVTAVLCVCYLVLLLMVESGLLLVEHQLTVTLILFAVMLCLHQLISVCTYRIAGNFRKCKFSKKIGIGFRINFRN